MRSICFRIFNISGVCSTPSGLEEISRFYTPCCTWGYYYLTLSGLREILRFYAPRFTPGYCCLTLSGLDIDGGNDFICTKIAA